MTHCSPATEACRSRPMAGNATLTMVLSRPTINKLKQQMTSTSTRRRWLSSGTWYHLDRRRESNCLTATNYPSLVAISGSRRIQAEMFVTGGQPRRDAVALAHWVVQSTPSRSTTYPQPARIHQPAWAAWTKLDCIDPRMLAARTQPPVATPLDWPSRGLEEFMPEAMPAWDLGIPDMTPLVIGELTMPAPIPNKA